MDQGPETAYDLGMLMVSNLVIDKIGGIKNIDFEISLGTPGLLLYGQKYYTSDASSAEAKQEITSDPKKSPIPIHVLPIQNPRKVF